MHESEQERIYELYHNKVQGYIRGKVSNVFQVEDLVSDVFMKVFSKLESFDSTKSSLSTWIYTITRNTVIDYFRTHKQVAELSADISSNFQMEDHILKQETLEELAIALEKMDERSRELIVLKYYLDYSLKTIAEVMDISYSNVKLLHNKALGKLKMYMKDIL